MSDERRCHRCHESKPLNSTNFRYLDTKYRQYANSCRSCEAEAHRKQVAKERLEREGKRLCGACGQTRPLELFRRDDFAHGDYARDCRGCRETLRVRREEKKIQAANQIQKAVLSRRCVSCERIHPLHLFEGQRRVCFDCENEAERLRNQAQVDMIRAAYPEFNPQSVQAPIQYEEHPVTKPLSEREQMTVMLVQQASAAKAEAERANQHLKSLEAAMAEIETERDQMRQQLKESEELATMYAQENDKLRQQVDDISQQLYNAQASEELTEEEIARLTPLGWAAAS